MDSNSQAVFTVAGAVVIAGALAVAGSIGGARVAGVPVFALAVVLAFVINWVAFVPSVRARTERFYDLTGSITYVSVIAVALLLGPGGGGVRTPLLGLLVVVWAVRLGTFLFTRVLADGNDRRFDTIKTRPVSFLATWTLQALWVSVTAAAALAAMTAGTPKALEASFGVWGWVGLALWVAGFTLEVVADAQKRAFRRRPTNGHRFITTGLWAWSRHPNYFGEIVLWVGIAVMAFPALSGVQYVTLISPLFVWVLLTRVSGIPLLEAKAAEQWGDDPAWRAYQQRTSRLVPRPPARAN